MTRVAPTMQAFFTERLIGQRHASPHTVLAYRDTIRLLLTWVADTTGVQPADLDFDHLDAPTIGALLTHLEHDRGVSVATRNARLAAIRSLFRYAAFRHPEHADTIARVLAIPAKRGNRALVTFLDTDEIDVLLSAPDQTTWGGRRDHTLLVVAVQTGLRVSELVSLRRHHVHLSAGAHVRVHGKGRKERVTPLSSHTVTAEGGACRGGDVREVETLGGHADVAVGPGRVGSADGGDRCDGEDDQSCARGDGGGDAGNAFGS